MTDDLQPDPPATQDDLPERGRRVLKAIGFIALAGLIAVVIVGAVAGVVCSSTDTVIKLGSM